MMATWALSAYVVEGDDDTIILWFRLQWDLTNHSSRMPDGNNNILTIHKARLYLGDLEEYVHMLGVRVQGVMLQGVGASHGISMVPQPRPTAALPHNAGDPFIGTKAALRNIVT